MSRDTNVCNSEAVRSSKIVAVDHFERTELRSLSPSYALIHQVTDMVASRPSDLLR